MAIEKSSVYVPKDILPLLENMVHGKNDEENVLVSLAISLFLSKTVSLAKAAELAGISLNDFIETLKIQELYWGEYTESEYYQDLGTIKSLTGALNIRND